MFKTDKAPAGSPVGAGNLRELLAPEKAQALKPRIDFRRLPGVQSSLTEAECRGVFIRRLENARITCVVTRNVRCPQLRMRFVLRASLTTA